jgi:hypothetical protein
MSELTEQELTLLRNFAHDAVYSYSLHHARLALRKLLEEHRHLKGELESCHKAYHDLLLEHEMENDL